MGQISMEKSQPAGSVLSGNQHEADIDGLLRHARRSLSGYAAELKWTKEPGDIRAAMATVLGLLAEAAELHPSMAAAIDEVINHYRPTALDG